jgi:Bifunctional DNA primase/polymerase, N-terminal
MTITADDYLRAIEAGADGLADHYGRQLDQAATAEREWYERPEALHLSALHYVTTYGLKVLPLSPGRKIPLGGRCCDGLHARGVTDATGDTLAVGDIWRAHPAANIGIATGHRVDVVDQDGAEGAVSWLRQDWQPDVIGIVSTPRAGGVHRYVATYGARNGARIAPGLDYRGRGGYVVAPPSIVGGRRYGWVQPLTLPR